jgi:hypothetical protein
MAQAVTRWPLIAEARVRAGVSLWDLWWTVTLGKVSLLVLRFYSVIVIQPVLHTHISFRG